MRSLLVQEFNFAMSNYEELEELKLILDLNGFPINGLTPAVYKKYKVSFSISNQDELNSMILLKTSLPYFRTVHEITFDTDLITSGKRFDQMLTDILHYFKPRVLRLRGGKKEEIYQNTKVQFRVPELTVNSNDDVLESVLSKVIPTHSLGIIKNSKINLS